MIMKHLPYYLSSTRVGWSQFQTVQYPLKHTQSHHSTLGDRLVRLESLNGWKAP